MKDKTYKNVINLKDLTGKIIYSCIIIEIILIILDIISYKYKSSLSNAYFIFDNTIESSLGSWFSIMQAFMAGLTLWAIFFIIRIKESSWKNTWGWFILASLFTLLSIDDGAMIHERIGGSFRKVSFSSGENIFIFLDKVKEIFPSYKWFIIFGPIYGVLFIFFLVFLWKKLKGLKLRRYIIIGLTYYFIACGLDFMEGFDRYEAMAKFLSFDRETVIHYFRIMEEWAEMLGTTIFWFAFLNYFAHVSNDTEVIFKEDDKNQKLICN